MTLEGTNTYVVGRHPGLRDRPRARRRAASRGRARGGPGSRRDRRCPAHPLARGPLGGRGDARRPAPVRRGRSGRRDLRRAGAARRPAGSAIATEPGRVGPFEILPTPGHATDHVCFLLGEVGFCGDLVLGHGSSFVPPDGGSLAAYLDSLERLRAADLELLCPGHGPYIEDPAAKDRRVPRAPPDARATGCWPSWRRGSDRGRASSIASGTTCRRGLRPAAAVVMQAHLEKLEAEGRLPEGLGA